VAVAAARVRDIAYGTESASINSDSEANLTTGEPEAIRDSSRDAFACVRSSHHYALGMFAQASFSLVPVRFGLSLGTAFFFVDSLSESRYLFVRGSVVVFGFVVHGTVRLVLTTRFHGAGFTEIPSICCAGAAVISRPRRSI